MKETATKKSAQAKPTQVKPIENKDDSVMRALKSSDSQVIARAIKDLLKREDIDDNKGGKYLC